MRIILYPLKGLVPGYQIYYTRVPYTPVNNNKCNAYVYNFM